MNPARLIIDQHRGPMNMAIDEALLLGASRRGPTLRFYQWEEPTLSLGYFQSAAERSHHEPSSGCPMVRRTTGGGAILHHYELTYSFAAPLDPAGKTSPEALYNAFHESLVLTLAELGIEASLFSAKSLQQIATEPFLCFQRRAEGDVLVGGTKVCGSAQRRQKSAVLQHGSVLLKQSPFAPELPGISDLTGKDVSFETLAKDWLPRLEQRLEFNFQLGSLDDGERTSSERLAEDRFGTDAWSLRR